MYCPECLSPIDNYRTCTNCSSDLTFLKPLVETSRLYFAQAYYSSRNKKFEPASEQIQLGLFTYPFLPEELKFAIVFFLFIGEFEKAIECLKIISSLDVPHADMAELVYQNIDRYNRILNHVQQKQYSLVLEEYINQLESLSLKELELLRISAEQSKHPSINEITMAISGRTLAAPQLESAPSRTNLIIAIAAVFVVVIASFLAWQLVQSNNTRDALFADFSLHLDSLTSEKIRLESQLSQSEQESHLLNEFYDAIFMENHDSLWTIFSHLRLLNSRWTNLNHEKLRPTAQYFYFKGRSNYLAGKYGLAAEYFDRSYSLNSDFWFSDDALYYSGLCYKLLKDDKQYRLFNKLVENHPGSVYWDDSINHLFDYYIETDVEQAKRLISLLDSHQKNSPYLVRLKSVVEKL